MERWNLQRERPRQSLTVHLFPKETKGSCASLSRGKAVVYLDDAKVATVDLFSTRTLARQIVFSRGNLDPATPHTLEVRSLGTAGHPRVDVDAFVVAR